jgi:hypothetical protein
MTAPSRLVGSLGHDFAPVAEVLAPLAGGRVVYVPNPGNAGDSLIAAATFQFLHALGLEVETGHWKGTYADTTVVYGGGGSFTEAGHVRPAARFVARHRDICRRLILLPHTVRGHDELLGTLDDRCTLFGRENTTLEHLRRAAPGARVLFCHDMALFADLEALKTPGGALPALPGPLASARGVEGARTRAAWRAKVVRRQLLRAGTPSPRDGVLNAFRTDAEKTDIARPPDNVDLSDHLRCSSGEAYMAGHVVRALMRAIAPHDRVRTNRLHIAVLATLMGKRVEAHDNSYGKIGDVCRASLTDVPNLSLAEPGHGGDGQRPARHAGMGT